MHTVERRPRVLLSLVALAVLSAGPGGAADPTFVRGDMNLDGEVNLVDASYYFDARYLGAPVPPCVDAVDANDSGAIEFATDADASFLLEWLFKSTLPLTLPTPFPVPGPDPTPDGLECNDSKVTPPIDSDPGYSMSWIGDFLVKPGEKDVEAFLLATTAGPIECFSIAFRADKKYIENVRVDLEGTVFPAALRAKLLASPVFRRRVVPSAEPARYDLLLAGGIFLCDPAALAGGDGGGGAFQRLLFAATTGPLKEAPLLRVRFDVRPDAPLGGFFDVLTAAPAADFVTAGDAVHGLRNDFGMRELPTSIPRAVRLMPGAARIGVGEGEQFLRGDSNVDSRVNIADASFTLDFLFKGGPATVCEDATDANNDGDIDVSDVVTTLIHLFGSIEELPWPGSGHCGDDIPFGDELHCDRGCVR